MPGVPHYGLLVKYKRTSFRNPKTPEPTPEERRAVAIALGRIRIGEKKGDKARAAKITPEECRESARKAAQNRWGRMG